MKKDISKTLGFTGKSVINPVSVMNLISDVIGTIKFCAEQETERSRINAQRDVCIAQIKSKEEIILDYLEKTFDERKGLFEKFFNRADKAMESGNNEQLAVILSGVTKLAESSPFKDLVDLERTKNTLKNREEIDI